MDRDALIEKLADIEHTRWADWQRWVHGSMLDHEGIDERFIPKLAIERWERQIATAYADLSEQEKQSDREQVARYWPLFVEFVGDWLDEKFEDGTVDNRPVVLREAWRREMQP